MKTSKIVKAVSPSNENVAAALDRIDTNSTQINKDHSIVYNEITSLREKLGVVTEEFEEYKESKQRELDDTKTTKDATIAKLTGERDSLRDKLLRVRAKIDE